MTSFAEKLQEFCGNRNRSKTVYLVCFLKPKSWREKKPYFSCVYCEENDEQIIKYRAILNLEQVLYY